MLSYQNPDAAFLHGLDDAVADLSNHIDPDKLMVVGARARDIIHTSLGHETRLRETYDMDIAIVVADMEKYHAIANIYPRVHSNGLGRKVAGYSVDLTPFGPVEQPEGTVPTSPEPHEINVLGFTDVYKNAHPLRLSDALTIRIPHPAGYTALKMQAWLDRSARGEYKDAVDLATAAMWYAHSPDVFDWLFESGSGRKLLVQSEMDVPLASALALGQQVRSQLQPHIAARLGAHWNRTDFDLMAKYSTGVRAAGWQDATWPGERSRQVTLLQALGMFLETG